jgi:predicted ATP-grasp superfamily ATP-dependent carboligase
MPASAGLRLDTTVPVLLLKLSHNVMQHGALGVIRTFGRAGVPVFATVEDRFAPAAMSRYLSGAFVANSPRDESYPMARMKEIGQLLNRPTVLVPTDDAAAIFIAENSATLAEWFLFPKLDSNLPRRLANKRALYSLCRGANVPCPEATFPRCMDDVHAFIERASFPVVIKAREPHRLPKDAVSVRIASTPEKLVSLCMDAHALRIRDVILQEYIPEVSSEDWFLHAYVNPRTDCWVAFTGRKLRSYPPFAGSTTLGVSELNEPLWRQTQKLLKAISYAGIIDLDYRFDKRDGCYKLLDFNPRLGANFRTFTDLDDLDVARAQHLDLTGRTVHLARGIASCTFIVEPYDVVTAGSYMRRNALTFHAWRKSLTGREKTELAWFCVDDPLPFLTMCVRFVLRVLGRLMRKSARPVWVPSRNPPETLPQAPRLRLLARAFFQKRQAQLSLTQPALEHTFSRTEVLKQTCMERTTPSTLVAEERIHEPAE